MVHHVIFYLYNTLHRHIYSISATVLMYELYVTVLYPECPADILKKYIKQGIF